MERHEKSNLKRDVVKCYITYTYVSYRTYDVP